MSKIYRNVLSLQIILNEKSLVMKLFSLKIGYEQKQDTEVNWKIFSLKKGKRGLGQGGGGGEGEKRPGLEPRNDFLTTCKAVTLCGGQRIIAVFLVGTSYMIIIMYLKLPIISYYILLLYYNTPIHPYISPYTPIHLHTPLYITINLYRSPYNPIHPHTLLYIAIYLYISPYTPIHYHSSL